MAGGDRGAGRAIVAPGAAAPGRNRDCALFEDRGGQRHQGRVTQRHRLYSCAADCRPCGTNDSPPLSPENDMKLMYFNDYKLGVIKDDTVVDVSAVVQNIAHTGPHDLI